MLGRKQARFDQHRTRASISVCTRSPLSIKIIVFGANAMLSPRGRRENHREPTFDQQIRAAAPTEAASAPTQVD
jgi:hypothetical protein